MRASTAERFALAPAGSKRPWLGPDRWFALFFLILILAFVVALLVQPSGVGRGGR